METNTDLLQIIFLIITQFLLLLKLKYHHRHNRLCMGIQFLHPRIRENKTMIKLKNMLTKCAATVTNTLKYNNCIF